MAVVAGRSTRSLDVTVEQPDKAEKQIRFGCGFLIGVVVGLGSMIAWSITNGWYFAAIVGAIALMCGFLAMRYGDEFWHSFLPKLWWW
jgi:hypothetical protein